MPLTGRGPQQAPGAKGSGHIDGAAARPETVFTGPMPTFAIDAQSPGRGLGHLGPAEEGEQGRGDSGNSSGRIGRIGRTEAQARRAQSPVHEHIAPPHQSPFQAPMQQHEHGQGLNGPHGVERGGLRRNLPLKGWLAPHEAEAEQAQMRRNTRVPLVPPKPKLFFTATSIFMSRAVPAQ